ncbi:MAG: hypothetical protein H6722_24105 [Sandaracinus sp.]|nr:hypothetical protein [Sandaracinus sp.]MCB9615526.1 hypothetical protein [Sandaracinus sp.]
MPGVAPYSPICVLREEPEGTLHVARAPDGKLVGLLEPRDDLPRLSPSTTDTQIFAPRQVVGPAAGRKAVVDVEPSVRLGALLAEGPLPPAFAARLLLDVLMSLARAHDHGQRVTVRPDRVLVGADARARVVVLGCEDDTMLASSLRFTAPEELEQAKDLRGDLWSAGVLFWEALVGKPLFAEHGWGLVTAIAERPLPRVADVRPELAPLQSFLDRMLSRDPEARFGSAREAAAAWIDAANEADGIASRDAFEVLVTSRAEAAFAAQEEALLDASRVPLATFEREVVTAVAKRPVPRAPEPDLTFTGSISTTTGSLHMPARLDPALVRIALIAFSVAFVLGAIARAMG